MRLRSTAFAVIALLCLASACDKPSGGAGGASPPDARAAQGANDTAASAGAPGSAAGASAAPKAVTSWQGSYKSAAGELYIPSTPDWKYVRYSVPDSGAGLGEGDLAFHVDPASGRVLGTLDGPLGPAIIDGVATDGRLAATIRRKEASDKGFTGTLIGSLASDGGAGTMSVSPGEASAVRAVTFVVAPAGASR